MENKKGFSVLKFFVVLVCIVLIALSLAVNIMFNQKNTPKIFGYYIYVLNNQDMGALLPEGTALISKDADGLDIKQGDVILCHLTGSDEVIIRTVYKTAADEATGALNYYLSTVNAQDENSVTDSVPKENIMALCTGYPQNVNLGRWISFTLGIKGIAIQLILPSILLVILLIAKIASVKDIEDEDEDEDEKDFSFHDEKNSKAKKDIKEAPLFVDPTPEDYTTDELERKKQSIAEHFSHKEVNPNSPYQKEKERTMQFKALKAAENASKSAPEPKKPQVDVTEMFTAPKNNNIHTEKTTSTADVLRQEMQRRTAEAEENAKKAAAEKLSASEKNSAPRKNTSLDIDDIIKKTESNEENIKKSVSEKKPASIRKSTSPDIDDIIKKTESNEKKKNVSSMSVDDLLKMIEDEKKKL